MNIVHPNYPPPAFEMTPRRLSDITVLIVHHSVGSPNQSPLDIDKEHRAENWAMVGYGYMIAGDGTIYKGRPDNVVPAAAEDMNTPSVDVCLLGEFQPGVEGFESSVPAAQWASLKELAVYLHRLYPTINSTIGHRDVSVLEHNPSVATACPGDVLYALLPALKQYVQSQL